MNEAEALELVQFSFSVLIKTAAPMIITAMAVGTLIALLQALTQIQEMTLTFVPKIIAIFLGMFAMLPYMNAELTAFMRILADQIIGISVN